MKKRKIVWEFFENWHLVLKEVSKKIVDELIVNFSDHFSISKDEKLKVLIKYEKVRIQIFKNGTVVINCHSQGAFNQFTRKLTDNLHEKLYDLVNQKREKKITATVDLLKQTVAEDNQNQNNLLLADQLKISLATPELKSKTIDAIQEKIVAEISKNIDEVANKQPTLQLQKAVLKPVKQPQPEKAKTVLKLHGKKPANQPKKTAAVQLQKLISKPVKQPLPKKQTELNLQLLEQKPDNELKDWVEKPPVEQSKKQPAPQLLKPIPKPVKQPQPQKQEEPNLKLQEEKPNTEPKNSIEKQPVDQPKKPVGSQAKSTVNFKVNYQPAKTNSFPKLLPQKIVKSSPAPDAKFFGGGDESGKGDYFGGIAVCVCYLPEKVLKELQKAKLDHRIKDSKKLSDRDIINDVPKIKKIMEKYYFCYTVNPSHFNRLQEYFQNINVVLAYMYNYAWNVLDQKMLQNKEPLLPKVIDQFVDPKIFNEYLQKVKNAKPGSMKLEHNTNLVHIDISETKAEDNYLAVAIASMIARYEFLDQIAMMSKLHGVEIPLGVNYDRLVDAFQKLQEINQLYRDHILNHLVKKSFITTKKIFAKLN